MGQKQINAGSLAGQSSETANTIFDDRLRVMCFSGVMVEKVADLPGLSAYNNSGNQLQIVEHIPKFI